MRRVTSFCVLVASMLILIHGARSEHAFRQNDRPPNALERDADKYNKPQVSTKLLVNKQEPVDASPVKADAKLESLSIVQIYTDSSTVAMSHTRRDARQRSARLSRRKGIRTADVGRQSTATRRRRRDTGSMDVVRQRTGKRQSRRDSRNKDAVRQRTGRTHRQRDNITRDIVRQKPARRHTRRDTDTRDAVRQYTVRINRRRDTRTTDSSKQSTNRRQLRRDSETRRVRQMLSSDSRRNIRYNRDINVSSRSITNRNDKRKRNIRTSRREFRNIVSERSAKRTIRVSRNDVRVSTYPHEENVNLYPVDSTPTTSEDKKAVMKITTAPTQSRSTRHRRQDVRNSRRNRKSDKRQVFIHTRRHVESYAELSAAPRLPVNGQGRRTDVRRRSRRNVKRVGRETKHDELSAVNGEFSMDISKGQSIQSAHVRDGRRVVRRARQTRGYRRISSSFDLRKTNKVDLLGKTAEGVEDEGVGVEILDNSSNNMQYEMTQPKLNEKPSLDLIDSSTKELVDRYNTAPTKAMSVSSKRVSGNANRIIMHRHRRHDHRRRTDETRPSDYRSSRSNGLLSRRGARQTYILRNSRIVRLGEKTAQRRIDRSVRRNLNHRRNRSRDSNDDTNDKHKTMRETSYISSERRTRYKRTQERKRSSRGVRRLRRDREAKSRNNRTKTGNDHHSVFSKRQQARRTTHIATDYQYLLQETRQQTSRSRQTGKRRRRREVRTHLGSHGHFENRLSQYQLNSYNVKGHDSLYTFDLPVTVYSSRNSRYLVRTSRSKRVKRQSKTGRRSPSHSPKALILTTKALGGQLPDIVDSDTVDQSHVPISKQQIFEKHSMPGTLQYFLNYLILRLKDFRNNEHLNNRKSTESIDQGMDICFRGVLLGVAAILSTHLVQRVSAPPLSLGRIRQGLLA